MTSKQLKLIVERIWLQGKNVLTPLLPITQDSIRYHVPGLDGKLELKDYRATGRAALEAAITEKGARDFHENFDSTALVTIKENDHSAIIELREPMGETAPVYDLLWIATNVNQPMPAWPTAWHIQSPRQDNRQSFVAILE